MAKKKAGKKTGRKRKKLAEELDFLMDHLKENGETSGEYAGTVLFLNGDSAKVEAALLAELMEVAGHADAGKGDIELAVWLVEQHCALLRLLDKFNRCRGTQGQYGKHYALELDIKEMRLLVRILDDFGITYWNY